MRCLKTNEYIIKQFLNRVISVLNTLDKLTKRIRFQTHLNYTVNKYAIVCPYIYIYRMSKRTCWFM